MVKRRQVLRLALSAAALAVTGVLRAETRTARIVLGFPPGALGDVFSRRLATMLVDSGYAASVIVDNKPGGGGRLALEVVRNAQPDGSVMLLQPSSLMTIMPHAFKKPPYNPFTDFIAVGAIGQMDMNLAINPKLVPVQTLVQYVDYVKQHPDIGLYGTGGIGSIPHLLGYMLAQASGAKIVHVPYRGGPAAFQDLVAGQIPAAIGALQRLTIDAHRAGRIRILATSGKQRNAATPDIPTFDEIFPGKGLVLTDYTGVWLPAKSPQAKVDLLSKTIIQLNQDKAFLGLYANQPFPLTSAEFSARVKSDYDKMGPVVKAVGFTLDIA